MADESTRDVDDLATARTLIATLQDELTRVQRENTSLRHQLDLLCQRLFGKKSERVSPDQLRLAFAQLGPVQARFQIGCKRNARNVRTS